MDTAELADHVMRTAATAKPIDLLVFDTTGVTGHPDHVAATCSARAAGERLRLPVIGWALPDRIAAQLNAELRTTFAGRPPSDLVWTIHVDRRVQRRARQPG